VTAVQTSHWTHTSEADFKKGTMHNVVATNLGDVKLSRAVKMIIDQDPKVSAVYALAEGPDGSIYAATGPHGVVLRIKEDKATPIAEFAENSSAFALLVDSKGNLLIGVSGLKGQVFRLDNPGAEGSKPTEIFSDDQAQYIWSIQQTPDGNLYIATGPSGKLFELKPDNSKSILMSSDESNLLSLLSDGKDLLYVGTDPNGLVYRVNRKNKEVFVLFDAPEAEITCLALDKKGNLYVGTGEAPETAAAKVSVPAAADKEGRPEGSGGIPLPSTPPEVPKPPAKPEPNPGEPDPIPKGKGACDLADAPPLPTPGEKPKPTTAAATQPAIPIPATPEVETPSIPKPPGNAIYRIDRDGFVTEIFRQPTMVLSLIEKDGTLLVGTGSDGLIYQVNPAAEETVVLAKVEPKQVMSMLATRDGRVLLGLANVGGVASMSSGFASEGTFTSPVLDATQISRFGKIHLQGSMPQGVTLTIATRSGNVQDPAKTGWSNWSDEMPAFEYVQVPSPTARFMQYRLTLGSKEGKSTPVVDEVDVAYQIPNVAPVVKSVKIAPANAAAAPTPAASPAAAAVSAAAAAAAAAASAATPNPDANRVQTISWEAEDANADTMQYALYFRTGSKAPWILLKEKLTETHYDWDTRSVADGRYEIKVLASDALSNPPGEGKTGVRVSDPIVVDNTPPVIGDVKSAVKGNAVTIDARAADRTSIVASFDYAVDSTTDWQLVLPSNKLFDSPQASVNFTVRGLGAGAHQITLRATDARGNQAFETLLVTIEAPTAER
jgi:WD40 repeat protein